MEIESGEYFLFMIRSKVNPMNFIDIQNPILVNHSISNKIKKGRFLNSNLIKSPHYYSVSRISLQWRIKSSGTFSLPCALLIRQNGYQISCELANAIHFQTSLFPLLKSRIEEKYPFWHPTPLVLSFGIICVGIAVVIGLLSRCFLAILDMYTLEFV